MTTVTQLRRRTAAVVALGACGLTACTVGAPRVSAAPTPAPAARSGPSTRPSPSPTAPSAPTALGLELELELEPAPGDGPVVYGPHSGVGSTTYPFGSFTIGYNDVLSIDVVCAGGGQLTVLVTSSFDSHPDTVVCDGRPAPVAQFPSDYFPGAIHLGVAGLAGQRWTVLAQAGP